MSFELIVAYSVFFLFVLMLATFTYVLILQNSLFKRDHRMTRIRKVWEDLVLSYLMSEEDNQNTLIALEKSTKNSKTVFYKFLFPFFENMAGEMRGKLNQLCRELQIDKFLYENCRSENDNHILEACSFIKYIELNENDFIIIELLDHPNYYVRMAALELLPKLSTTIKFEILFRQLNDIPFLTSRKKLQILEKFGPSIFPELIDYLKDPLTKDYHKSLLIELLTFAKHFRINFTTMTLFTESKDIRLKRKIIDYFKESKNKRFLIFLLLSEELMNASVYQEILKYFYSIDYYDDNLISLFFTKSDNQWTKIEIIKLIKKQFAMDSFKFVDNGVISSEFYEFMNQKRLCYLTN
jgi:hypothetical protein